MTVPLRVRRPLVLLGVVVSLLIGTASIRAAAAWTAASSPLTARPPSVESLQAALATEQDRSAVLRVQLDGLAAGSTDLTAALEAARDRIAVDAAQATQLQASLAAAQAKLAALERSIGQARTATARSTATAPPRAATTTAEPHEDQEDHREPGELEGD
jgi:chromosome segregation ATPase